MRVCSKPGCPTIYAGTDSRCPAHQAQADKARGTAKQRGYTGRGHRTFRNAVLEADPICCACQLAFSTVADHYPLSRRELVDQGLDPNAPENGRGLCARCHSIITANTPGQRGGWNRRE